jgi:hydrogenase maturation protease
MPRVLIIAYGNPLRCDDGVAWRAAEELSRLNLPQDVDMVTCHQLTPELAHPVSQASVVVFIDAARNGTPGEITSTTPQPQPRSSIFTHEFSPAVLLRVAQELYGKCPPASVVSMCGQCFDHGESLSAIVTHSLPGMVARIQHMVERSTGTA